MLKGSTKKVPFSKIKKPKRMAPKETGLTPMDLEEEIQNVTDNADVIVDVSEPTKVSYDEDGVKITDTGETTYVDFDPENSAEEYLNEGDEDEFLEDLCEYIDEDTLDTLAQDLLEKIQNDITSRADWEGRYKKAMQLLGVVKQNEGGGAFEGASSVVYPLLMDAVVQFQARAMAEMFPSSGPIKTIITGEATEEKRQKQKRVKNYMNYQVTVEDEAYFEELDRMLMNLPISGSQFKKTYFDILLETVVSKQVRPDDLVVPYTATSLVDAPRITHIQEINRNEMRIKQAKGFYRDVELVDPSADGDEGKTSNTIKETDDKADFKTPVLDEDDYQHKVYETCVDLDLAGFEDKENGKKTGIALPYMVSIDTDSKKILSIRRNWEQSDELRKKRIYFTHYKYHVIGGLSEAATGALRALLDAAAFSTVQGGFRSKDVSMGSQGDIILTPGEWKDVDMSAEDLNKAFFTPPFKEPSSTLYNLLNFIVAAGKEAASLTEANVGQGGANTPVGTELARIEQGSKVYSGIHKRLHNSAASEFRLRAKLNGEYLDDYNPYTYATEEESNEIFGLDFDGSIEVIPVSDPNIMSSALRIAQAQAVRQMAAERPEMYNLYEVERRMLEAQNIPGIDEILIDPKEIPRLDPIAEVQAIMMQRPVRAYSDQDHTAHIKVITAFMEHPNFGGNPQVAELIMPNLVAILAEHKAYEFAQIMGASGSAYIETDLQAPAGKSIYDREISIDEEKLITQTAAEAVDQFLQLPGAPLPGDAQEGQGPSPEELKLQAEIGQITANTEKVQAETAKMMQPEVQDGQQSMDVVQKQEELRIKAEESEAKQDEITANISEKMKRVELDERKIMLEEQKLSLEEKKLMQDKELKLAEIEAKERESLVKITADAEKEQKKAEATEKKELGKQEEKTAKIVEKYSQDIKSMIEKNSQQKSITVKRNAKGELEGATITPAKESKETKKKVTAQEKTEKIE
jgi:hypothetical protein